MCRKKLLRQLLFSDLHIYEEKIFVCLLVWIFGFPIITHEPLDRSVSNFALGTRQDHQDDLSLRFGKN